MQRKQNGSNYRFAKHMIDDKSFFGGILHVCYAPELETISETRHKLDQRRHEVLKRLSQYAAADLKHVFLLFILSDVLILFKCISLI